MSRNSTPTTSPQQLPVDCRQQNNYYQSSHFINPYSLPSPSYPHQHRSHGTTHSTNMSPSQSSSSSLQPYLLVPNLTVPDPYAREVDLGTHPWIVTTEIEDGDLTFGGKPLSTWYEEERHRQSHRSDDEEERRGRQRERPRYYDSHHGHGHKDLHEHRSKTGKDAKQ